jgi:hypothetical protein
MLKKRIHKWNLDKKHKEPDMLAALRIASEREAQGKKTSFVIRNREVTLEQVKHYFKRKGIMRVLPAASEIRTSESSMSCYTPRATTPVDDISAPTSQDLDEVAIDIGELPEDRDTFKIVVHKASKITATSLAERMRPTLPPPADLGRLELFLACTRECHEVFTQCRPPTEFWLPPVAVREFYYSMMKGYLFLAMRYYSHGFVHFQTAFDLLATILKHRDMIFLLSCMYGLTELFDDEDNHEILCRLCDYVIRLSAIYIENTRLFKQTVISFRDIPRGDRAKSASRGLDYLHAKGKLWPWMTSWMVSRRVFDSQEPSQIMGEIHLKRGQTCPREPVEFSADQTTPTSLLPPEVRRTTCLTISVLISTNCYIALNQDLSREIGTIFVRGPCWNVLRPT